ncbi:MAG: hypothetical protein AB8F95_02310 [Bacteroidia bacterium]
MKANRLFLLVLMSVLLIACSSKVKSPSEANTVGKATLVIEKLDSLGFFRITDKDKTEEAKTEMISAYNHQHFFVGLTYSESLTYVDHRFYHVDQEELFELYGLPKYLKEVQTTFELLGLKLNVENDDNHEESFKDNFWEHTITLNGKEYTAFKGEMDEDSWGIAMVNFANMLNDQLRLQQSEEQVYLLYNGNDGMLVFLTPAMFDLVEKHYPDNQDRPMTIERWKRYYGIE